MSGGNVAAEAQKAAAAQQAVEEQVRIQKASTAQSSRAAVLQGLADGESEDDDAENEVVGYLEDDEKESKKENYQLEQPSKSRALTQQDDAPPVSPLCIRIQVHAEGITEALLFHVDLLASAIRQAVIIKDHKSFLKVHPNTFRGQAAIEWLRGHAARALFGSEAEKEKNQQLSRSVALLLGQKLLAVGVFRQVTGSLTKPLEDPNLI